MPKFGSTNGSSTGTDSRLETLYNRRQRPSQGVSAPADGLSRSRGPRGLSATLVLGAVLALFSLLTLGGCKPKYPACKEDSHCQDNEFCVANQCQQCRGDADCEASNGPGYMCNAGACEQVPGYCASEADCTAGSVCLENQCQPCDGDNQCAAGQKCLAGACTQPECETDAQCRQDQECKEGFCAALAEPIDTSGPPCPLTTVYFGFDESILTTEAMSNLNANWSCLRTTDRSVTLIGRADPRGTEEYNLALSARRAESVKEHLRRLGVSGVRLVVLPRGDLDAQGSSEAGWIMDRRVDFEWR